MRKWTYPYLEVLAEKVQKMNKIFRSPGRAEVQKAEPDLWQSRQSRSTDADLHIFGSHGRDEIRNLLYLEVLQNKCGR